LFFYEQFKHLLLTLNCTLLQLHDCPEIVGAVDLDLITVCIDVAKLEELRLFSEIYPDKFLNIFVGGTFIYFENMDLGFVFDLDHK